VLLAPGSCHSNLRFFTRGSVIGGESISLRAFAVINQTAGFLTRLALQSRNRELRQFPFNKPGNEINVSKTRQFRGFLY
jgi:hypothetical protein